MGNQQNSQINGSQNLQIVKEKLGQELQKPLSTDDKKQTLTTVQHLVELYQTAECECRAPNFVFWLSENKRNKCVKAKTEFAVALVECGLNTIEDAQKQTLQ